MVELVGLRIVLGTFPSPQSVQGRRTHNIFENILQCKFIFENFGPFFSSKELISGPSAASGSWKSSGWTLYSTFGTSNENFDV